LPRGGGGETHPRTHRWAEPRRTRKTSYTYIHERVRAARERRPRRSNRARGEYNARGAEFLQHGPRKRNHRWGSGWNEQRGTKPEGQGGDAAPRHAAHTGAAQKGSGTHTHRRKDAGPSHIRRQKQPGAEPGRWQCENGRPLQSRHGKPIWETIWATTPAQGGSPGWRPPKHTNCLHTAQGTKHTHQLQHPHRPRRTPESMHRITNVRRDTAPRPSGGARVWVANEPPHRRGAGAARRRAREERCAPRETCEAHMNCKEQYEKTRKDGQEYTHTHQHTLTHTPRTEERGDRQRNRDAAWPRRARRE
jgi:hypothetical protein